MRRRVTMGLEFCGGVLTIRVAYLGQNTPD